MLKRAIREKIAQRYEKNFILANIFTLFLKKSSFSVISALQLLKYGVISCNLQKFFVTLYVFALFAARCSAIRMTGA